MANNQNTNNLDETNTENTLAADDFGATKQAQDLGGGKGDERKIDLGVKNDGTEFSQTDQSVTQAAPGQTATNTTQGGSNA